MTNQNSFTVDCECGCTKIVIDNLDEFVSFSAYRSEYQSRSIGILGTIKNRIVSIWYAVIGKDYCLYDIIMYPETFEKFKKFINEQYVKSE